MDNWVFKENSLDAIRLIAASQVAVLHAYKFMLPGHPNTLFIDLLRLFPGVPIFFFISGYLISKSYERSPDHWEYTKNRVLRIYPALIACVVINVIMVWSTGYFDIVSPSQTDIALLIVAKSTVVQYYNPDFMRAFGDGVLNGSLWTICVELQFYLLTPFIYLLFCKNKQLSNKTILLAIVIFIAANRLLFYWAPEYSNNIFWKLFRVSFTPWIYMFLTGILFQRNFETIAAIAKNIPALPLLALYIFASYISFKAGVGTDNNVHPLIFFAIALVIFRLSYYKPHIVKKSLRGNDISYGIYIWHMPIMNQLLYLGYQDDRTAAAFTIVITFIIALLSWKLLEKPALKMKHYTLNKY